MIPRTLLLCANPRCSGITWEARCPQEPDVPRLYPLHMENRLLVTQVTDPRKKNHVKNIKATYIFTRILGTSEQATKYIEGGKRKKTTE